MAIAFTCARACLALSVATASRAFAAAGDDSSPAALAASASSRHAATGRTTFLSAREMAPAVARALVRVDAQGVGSHGFGLVVAVDDAAWWVLVPRHVLAAPRERGLDEPERLAASFAVTPCAGPQVPMPATLSELPARGASDLAVLRVPRPAADPPTSRLEAPADAVVAGAETLVLGFQDTCDLLGTSGHVEIGPDAAGVVRLRHPSVQGGTSGGVVLLGEGVAALVTDSDGINIRAVTLARARQVVADSALPWGLLGADNIPPTDPLAAQVDLSETLDRWLFATRNMQSLLLLSRVPPTQFRAAMDQYNAALRRFRDARDKYDGTLARHYAPGVLAAWSRLRESVWRIHLSFWSINDSTEAIYRTGHVPEGAAQRLRGLDPALEVVEQDIASFLHLLGSGEKTP